MTHYPTKLKRIQIKATGEIKKVYSSHSPIIDSMLMIDGVNFEMYRHYRNEYDEIKAFNDEINETTITEYIHNSYDYIPIYNIYNCKYSCEPCLEKCAFYESE